MFTVEVIQHTALVWLHEFIQLSGVTMLPFASGILTAILPCFSYDDDIHRNTIAAARNVNSSLMKLVAGNSKGNFHSVTSSPSVFHAQQQSLCVS